MENTAILRTEQTEVSGGPGVGTFIGAFFLAWFVLVFVLGARGAFVGSPGAPPLALLVALVVPLGLFLVGYRNIRPVRDFILSADLKLIVGMQAWRWAGFGFLALYANRVLPGMFALPAGLGDMAVGITAPLMLSGLLRRPGFSTGRRFAVWNLLGILDLVVAISVGALVPLLAPSFYGAASTSPMAQLPLVLIPTFLVPTFLMLHLTALFQARRR